MVTDFMVLLMPVPIIWKLKLPISQRIALTATFGLGLLSVPYFHIDLFFFMPAEEAITEIRGK